jgi:hypothetical protein
MALFVLYRGSVREVVLGHSRGTCQANTFKVIGKQFVITFSQVLGQVVHILDNLDLVAKTLFEQWFGQVPNTSKTLWRIDNEKYIDTHRDLVLQ